MLSSVLPYRSIPARALLWLMGAALAVSGGASLRAAALLVLNKPTLQAGQLTITWSGGTAPFQLQEAPSPSGPWQALGQPVTDSSTQVPVGPSRRFFRVVDQAGAGGDGTEQRFYDALGSIGAFVNTVPRGDRAAWKKTLLAFLRARADIEIADESDDGVWAITKDGLPLTIWNNRKFDPPGLEDPVPPAPQLAGTETPGNSVARLSTTVGKGFVLGAPRLGRLMAGHDYSPRSDSAPLESLKGQRSESVFFFNTHGGMMAIPLFDGSGKLAHETDGTVSHVLTYGLWSGTQVNTNVTNPGFSYGEFLTELKAKRLSVALAPAFSATDATGNEITVNEWHYGITPEWVQAYLSFPKANHASVWLAACRSGGPKASFMRAAFRSVGAEMVSSWTQDVTGEAILSATPFLWDRLLGANEVQPPATPQRPFDYENSWTELRSKGIHRHPTTDDNGNPITTEIVYEGDSGDGAFGLFAPSIKYVLIDELSDTAHLVGLFGNPPAGQRRVSIGGVEVGVNSWASREVVCALARTGPASAGEVQVVVNGHKSNIRRITRWTLIGNYKMSEAGTPHLMQGDFHLILRADVGEYRLVPGNVFIRPTRYAIPNQDSTLELSATGTQAEPCGDQYPNRFEKNIWLGAGPIPMYSNQQNQMLVSCVALNTIDQVGALGFALGTMDPDLLPTKIRYEPCPGGSVTFPLPPGPAGPVDGEPLLFRWPLEELLPEEGQGQFPLPGGTFTLGNDFGIAGGSADAEPGGDISSGMTWTAAAAEFAPDPKAAR